MRNVVCFGLAAMLLLVGCNKEERAQRAFTKKVAGKWNIDRQYFPGADSSAMQNTGRWIDLQPDGTLISNGPGDSIASHWAYDPERELFCVRKDSTTTRPDCFKVDVNEQNMRWTLISGDQPGFLTITFSAR